MSCYLQGFIPPGVDPGAIYRHAWGLSQRFEGPLVGTLFLCVGEDGYSSKHYHINHNNTIRVHQGILDIEVGDRWHRLEGGGCLTIPPGTPHRLVVVDSPIFTETYLGPPGSGDPREDIVRLDSGSPEHWRP